MLANALVFLGLAAALATPYVFAIHLLSWAARAQSQEIEQHG